MLTGVDFTFFYWRGVKGNRDELGSHVELFLFFSFVFYALFFWSAFPLCFD